MNINIYIYKIDIFFMCKIIFDIFRIFFIDIKVIFVKYIFLKVKVRGKDFDNIKVLFLRCEKILFNVCRVSYILNEN